MRRYAVTVYSWTEAAPEDMLRMVYKESALNAHDLVMAIRSRYPDTMQVAFGPVGEPWGKKLA